VRVARIPLQPSAVLSVRDSRRPRGTLLFPLAVFCEQSLWELPMPFRAAARVRMTRKSLSFYETEPCGLCARRAAGLKACSSKQDCSCKTSQREQQECACRESRTDRTADGCSGIRATRTGLLAIAFPPAIGIQAARPAGAGKACRSPQKSWHWLRTSPLEEVSGEVDIIVGLLPRRYRCHFAHRAYRVMRSHGQSAAD